MNRFKGLDLVDRAPEDRWTEVRNIEQEAANKTIPKERKARRQSGYLRRLYKQLKKEVKSKGERERYTELNAGFQRIARRARQPFSMNSGNRGKQQKGKD